MSKQIIVIRGIPGAGKTTMAHQLKDDFERSGKTAECLEYTMYYAEAGTSYKDSGEHDKASMWLDERIRSILPTADAVIVSNTCLHKDDIYGFRALADDNGAELTVYRLETQWENKVPAYVSQGLKSVFEPWPEEIVIPAGDETALPESEHKLTSTLKPMPTWFKTVLHGE